MSSERSSAFNVYLLIGVLVWAFVCAFVLCAPARAAVTVLVGEPYGSFGTMMPSGHTTLYLDRVCADGPLKLRMCSPGEAPGVAIARYDRLGPYDWIATPILEFLYATGRPEEVPAYADADALKRLRLAWYHQTLGAIFPADHENDHAGIEWWETVGAAFNRRFWGLRLASTREQDEAFVAVMNSRPNRRVYRIHRYNCADFTAELVNFYFPGTVRANRVADMGIMSPKQVARSVAGYGQTHPEAEFTVFEIPQVPGPARRSRPIRGGAEMFLKTKRYVAALSILQPELVATFLVLYLDRGRWTIGPPKEILGPGDFAAPVRTVLAAR